MGRREFIKLVSAAVITISFPKIVTASMDSIKCLDSRSVANLTLKDVKIISRIKIHGTEVAVIRAFVPFKDDTLWVVVTVSEKLLNVTEGVGFVIRNIMICAKEKFKYEKNIDVTFEGYELPKRILDKSR